MTVRIVFFGSIPVARECLQLVHAHPDAEVVGVCAVPLERTWRKEQSVEDFALANDLPIIDHADIPKLRPDMGLSVRYHRVLKSETLAAFTHGVVNVHGGLLPRYRGSYCNIHAILNGDHEFGVTMHYMDSGLDTGDIIGRLSIPISNDATGFDLYRESERLCLEVVRQQLDNLITGSAHGVSQDEFIAAGERAHEYKRSDLEGLRELQPEQIGTGKSLRVIRAFDSPHHEPAYTVVDGQNVYLRIRW